MGADLCDGHLDRRQYPVRTGATLDTGSNGLGDASGGAREHCVADVFLAADIAIIVALEQ
jgi:hypothetical protein